ncbi:class I SAM-dependent methyltransferase [Vibrio europaeus]|uniref:class I SAM-dependent DNA methyltransferase n=1 Tax=Vibrio europaeus TaxID=300876 RepID=UPI0023423246|nr:class I SAM-dependent methyltransferase [Vibrio europaeus]MDC5851633.1 class I SAM-dependent methyltransferase [Vibrio europaeus]
MDENSDIWRQYYEKALAKPHLKRTEFVVELNKSSAKVAIDCGCGTGGDIDYLLGQGYQVHGFDVNPDAIAICRDRFGRNALADISQSSFEDYDYPQCGLVIANNSLFFADPSRFLRTWEKIESSLVEGGVFAGDFMETKDSWANNYRSPTTPLTESEVRALFSNFEIIRFVERDEKAETALGRQKHWHTFSVVAVKRN